MRKESEFTLLFNANKLHHHMEMRSFYFLIDIMRLNEPII